MLRSLYVLYAVFIAFPIFFVVSVIISTIVIIAAFLGDKVYIGYYLPKLWARIACWLYFVRVRIEGRENIDKHQSYVFLANHQGYFDIFLVYGYLGHNFKWMLKKYLRKIPFVGRACEASGHVYIGERPSEITRAVRQAERTLKHGMSMVIFPEGTRTHDGRMNPFKRGAFILAQHIDLPIVPMTINGSFYVYSRSAKCARPGTITLTIHRPIMPAERSKYDEAEFMQHVFDIINSAVVPEYRV